MNFKRLPHKFFSFLRTPIGIAAILFISIITLTTFRGITQLDGVITEAIGIFFTYLVIERYRHREAKRHAEMREAEAKKQEQLREEADLKDYKKSLLRQARSRSNSNALDAIDIIREEKWLDGSDAEGTKLLIDANLSSANLSSANLRGAYLEKTKFNEKAKLIKADLEDSILIDAEFIDAELKETNFAGARFYGANFSYARLYCCTFQTDHSIGRKQATFNDKSISFSNAKLTGGKVTGDDGVEREEEKHIDFRDLDLRNANFMNANLKKVCFDGAYLRGCNFSGATLEEVTFNDKTDLKEAKFVEIDSKGPHPANQLTSIFFRDAILDNADLSYVSFVACDFFEAKMLNAKCQNSSFSGGTNFHSADLSNIVVTDAKFDNVKFNGDTIFIESPNLQKIFETLRDTSADAIDVGIEEKFKEKIYDIAEKYNMKSLIAKITLDRYEARERVRDQTEEGDPIVETDWIIKEDTPLIIEVRYPSPMQVDPLESDKRPTPDKSKVSKLYEDNEF